MHQIIQFQYRYDCQLLANGQVQDVCMSPIKGQSVKSALQYNSQLRNMSDMQFMRHLGWVDTGARDRYGGGLANRNCAGGNLRNAPPSLDQ